MRPVYDSSALLRQARRRLWAVRTSVILVIGVLAGVAVNKHSLPMLVVALILGLLVAKTRNADHYN